MTVPPPNAGATPLPHPVTGQSFVSPVPPGTGWPGDPSAPDTPVATDTQSVVDLAADCADLEDLQARVGMCRACPRLLAWREQVAVHKRAAYADEPYWGRPVPPFGDPAARVLVVGLAPAAHGGNRTGRMFTGDRSGDWLYAALHRAGYANQPDSRAAGDGLALAGARIVAAARCAPPRNVLTAQERATCAPWLRRELELLTPGLTAILALGGVGWDALLRVTDDLGWQRPKPRPRFGHGAVAALRPPGRAPVRLVGSYHVSQQNTFTGRLTASMLDEVCSALEGQISSEA